jgi:hypothetical protein
VTQLVKEFSEACVTILPGTPAQTLLPATHAGVVVTSCRVSVLASRTPEEEYTSATALPATGSVADHPVQLHVPAVAPCKSMTVIKVSKSGLYAR